MGPGCGPKPKPKPKAKINLGLDSEFNFKSLKFLTPKKKSYLYYVSRHAQHECFN